MGRYVYEKGNCVWKYIFAGQNSEQYLIAEHLGVGEIVKQNDFGDTLRIERNDLPKLEQALIPHCEMLRNYKKFLRKLSPMGWIDDRQEKILYTWLMANDYKGIYFWCMVRAFVKYIRKSPTRRKVFYFEGEY